MVEKLKFIGVCINSRCNQMIFSHNDFDKPNYCDNCQEKYKVTSKRDRIGTIQKTLDEVIKK